MPQEIERKFLVDDDGWRRQADAGTWVRQGYLVGGEACSVRVRVAGSGAWLNIKSATLGVSRREYEYAIPPAEAREMLDTLCARPLVEKVRYRVVHGDHVWEIDCFEGDNAGLVVAEVELGAPDEPFERPPWIGRDVSDRPRYYNSCLVRYPFREWSDAERAGD